MDRSLERVLALSGIGQFQRHQWFEDCRLVGGSIRCSDEEIIPSLVNCWLPQIRAVLPGCTIVYEPERKAFTGAAPVLRKLEGL